MRILDWLEQRPIWVRAPVKVLMVALLGLVDWATGSEIAFSIFYLVPIATTAWIDGKLAGVCMSLICGGVWLLADLAGGHEYTKPWIPYWNMTVRIGFFATVADILFRLRLSLARERELSRTDSLTGLWNVRYFLELAEREAERCRRFARPITIAYIDLDNFKAVNDSKGHAEGDELLHRVGEKIREELRSQDVPARLGGDEFALLLPETSFEESSVALRRLKGSLDLMMQAHNSMVTFSVGAVTFQTPLSSVEEMIRAADDLMYGVKTSGKGAIRHEQARRDQSSDGTQGR
jgi:diguanylate cyclase (GGDEF)-like protein